MRKEGWEAILRNYIEDSRKLSFEWGKSDCALWVAGYFDQVTGSSFLKEYKGQYSDEQGAYSLLHQLGFTDITDLPSVYAPPVPINYAKRGDIISFNGALGICDGRKSYILTVEVGLFAVLTAACQKAWAV
jgi:hypothetical protein